MHPLFIVAKREFLQRVRQKSFWIMLLLGPLFMIIVMIVPIGLAMKKDGHFEVLYLNDSPELEPYLYSDNRLSFVKASGPLKETFQRAKQGGYAGLLTIGIDSGTWVCRLYPSGMGGQSSEILKWVIRQRITEYEVVDRQHLSLPHISYREASMAEVAKGEADATAGFIAGLFVAVLVLVFINQYSHMVLRGVVEEKQNRISELILTSIKPMHFITGKIVGIASVSFLQMGVWCGLTGLLSATVYKGFQLQRFSDQHLAETLQKTHDVQQTLEMNSMLNAVASLDMGVLAFGFLFYFVFGYLLYSALFAMIGIAVGSDTDAQQLAIPFTLPLALPVILLQYIMDNQDASLTRFLSLFPLTSPTTMLLRLPVGVPLWETMVSAVILVLTFFLTAFTASKVYRIGIFMYGKKFSLKELWRWSRS